MSNKLFCGVYFIKYAPQTVLWLLETPQHANGIKNKILYAVKPDYLYPYP